MKQYFKGWYFKCQSANDTIAFIPAYHCDGNILRVSLQIIVNDQVFHVSYPLGSLKFDEKTLRISLGSSHLGISHFSKDGIRLSIKTGEIRASGLLSFHHTHPLSYDIMGPFSILPFLQCRHHVYSMYHTVNGSLTINRKTYHFHNADGYIEGDEGSSFPQRYIWTQGFFSVDRTNPCTVRKTTPAKNSLMLSVATIPFLGFQFHGIIGVILYRGLEYRIGTYLLARLTSISKNHVGISQGPLKLHIKLNQNSSRSLLAPYKGKMTRIIKEAPSATVICDLACYDKHVHFVMNKASYEMEWHTK